MNLLLLAIAFRVWSGTAVSAFLRLMAAIALFSLEMQVATWWQLGTLRSLRLVNVGIAAAGVLWHAHWRARGRRAHTPGRADDVESPLALPDRRPRLPPVSGILALTAIVTALALLRPVTGADPYHLHRVDQITARGTLAYDPAAPDIKVNALAGVYELLLADLRIPGMATAFVRLHGVLGLGFYLVSVAAAARWIPLRRRWPLLIFLVVPVIFHQFVLVKNDLFGALPAFVALAWVVARGSRMSVGDVAAAAALAGFAVGVKISSAPLAIVVALFVIADHHKWRPIGAALGAGLAGAVAGGLLFTLAANHAVYGGAVGPYVSLGNRHESVGSALIGVGRFAMSLIDLGTVTPRVWPGRGGWGSTFGLPLVWALVVLACRRGDRTAQRALIAGAGGFIAFAASYPDADIAHRLVVAPGLLMILVAVGLVDREDRQSAWLRHALIPVLALSALQVARSAVLYLQR